MSLFSVIHTNSTNFNVLTRNSLNSTGEFIESNLHKSLFLQFLIYWVSALKMEDLKPDFDDGWANSRNFFYPFVYPKSKMLSQKNERMLPSRFSKKTNFSNF